MPIILCNSLMWPWWPLLLPRAKHTTHSGGKSNHGGHWEVSRPPFPFCQEEVNPVMVNGIYLKMIFVVN